MLVECTKDSNKVARGPVSPLSFGEVYSVEILSVTWASEE